MIKIEGEQELTFRFAIKTYQEKFNLATFKQAQKLFFEAVLNFDVDLITDYFNKTLGKTVMPN